MALPPPSTSPPLTPQTAHIVVIEDDANALLIMMRLLKLAGVEQVNWRSTGKEVAAFVRAMSASTAERRPDLILLDINLPGEDGFGVLAELRADPALRPARIVAVTIRNSPIEVQRAQAAGFDGFLGKPLNAEKFPERLRRLLAGEPVWEPE